MNPDDVKRLVEEVLAEVKARQGSPRRVAIGSDHGGFALKARLVRMLEGLGHRVLDVGTATPEACDYPDFAKRVARAILDGSCEAGIMIDGAGIGSSMVCNRFKGIRAALCYDMKTILNSRQHNAANLLTLGATSQPPEVIEEMVKTWLATPFEGGRNQRRVDKIELDG